MLCLLSILFFAAFVSYSQDLQKPFQDCHIDGSITLYDYNQKKWISSDINDSHQPSLPASTFKILNTLILLESGTVESEKDIIKWPGSTDTVKYGYRPDIYHDMDMEEAFKVSAGWVYRELAKKVGKKRYSDYLIKCKYGNANVSVTDPDFWNYGPFAISPVNQIETLISIYEEKLPFSKRSYEILKRMMVEEETEEYIVRAKTGWTMEGGLDTGWWIGYIEQKQQKNIYFFATRLIKDRRIANKQFAKCRKEITKRILKDLKMLN